MKLNIERGSNGALKKRVDHLYNLLKIAGAVSIILAGYGIKLQIDLGKAQELAEHQITLIKEAGKIEREALKNTAQETVASEAKQQVEKIVGKTISEIKELRGELNTQETIIRGCKKICVNCF